jgi:hypothetical protein
MSQITSSGSGGGGAGDVVGPASSTDNAVARFDGVTGKLIQNSVVIIDDSGNTSGVAALTTSGIVTQGSGQVVKRAAAGASPYTVLSTDYIVEVNTGSAYTIRLPNAPTAGTEYVIKDVTGTAAANNITLTTVGGAVTIDGVTSVAINTNYASVRVYFNGTSYFLI